jgi:hypothetical protein
MKDENYFTATSEEDQLNIVIQFITEENHLNCSPFDYQWNQRSFSSG